MKVGYLKQLLCSYVTDDAECKIGENPKCLMVVENNVCIMINLDGDWEKELQS